MSKLRLIVNDFKEHNYALDQKNQKDQNLEFFFFV